MAVAIRAISDSCAERLVALIGEYRAAEAALLAATLRQIRAKRALRGAEYEAHLAGTASGKNEQERAARLWRITCEQRREWDAAEEAHLRALAERDVLLEESRVLRTVAPLRPPSPPA